MDLRIVALLLLLVTGFSACRKSCDQKPSDLVAPSTEITALQDYLNSKSIIASQHTSGMFYVVQQQGDGDTPDLCSSVTVRYTGTLTNGSVFDKSTSNVSFPLNNLITGWQLGIPLIKKGGRIILYIPPTLGYGPAGSGSIPANSILIFDIELVGVVQ